MGELARQRSARNIWISRSHVAAMGAGALFLTLTAFGAGALVAGSERPAVAAQPADTRCDPVVDDSLVELLARVEASTDPTSGMRDLTFPDALTGEAEEWAIPLESPRVSGIARVEPAYGSEVPAGDRLPSGEWTVEVLRTEHGDRAEALRDQLLSRDLPAWVGAERIGGRASYRVAIGGWSSAAEAREALSAFRVVAPELPLLEKAEVAETDPQHP